MELPGIIVIEDVYADINQNKIFIRGNKTDFNKEKMNLSDEGIKFNETKIKKNTCKFGKFNLIIPYDNEIKLSDEMPVDEENNNFKIPEGIKIFKFSLAKRRERKNKQE